MRNTFQPEVWIPAFAGMTVVLFLMAMSLAYAQDVPKPEQAPTRVPFFKAFRMKPILEPQLNEEGSSLVVQEKEDKPKPVIKRKLELRNKQPEVPKGEVVAVVDVVVVPPVPPTKPKFDQHEIVPAAQQPVPDQDVAMSPATTENDVLPEVSGIRKPIEELIKKFETKEETPQEKEEEVVELGEDVVETVVDGMPIPSQKPIMSDVADSTFIERIFATPSARRQDVERVTAVRIMGGNEHERSAGLERLERSSSRGRFLDNDLSRMNVGKLKEVGGRSNVLLPGFTRVVAAPDAPKADRRGVPSEVIVFFQENSTKLEAGQMDILQSDVIDVMNRNGSLELEIVGYSENVGDNTKKLSEERAVMILKYLQKKRISAKRLTVKGKANKTGVEPRDRVEMYFSR